ncbi:hypothetical protein CcaverHIS641_0108980 [Cutaneotrichosporon cavernicola]|nr:hypothetical protein CcaverHIS641_0108980 [Cutaneotrichosporon cavernicola]
MSCQTCLSDLRAPPAFIPDCCGAPVCAACVASNPRLTSWVPCLRCGSSLPKPPDHTDQAGIKVTRVDGKQPNPQPKEEDDQFVLVARQYATDPHTLLALNDLPHAALYANPRLIATRPKLVISRRLVNAKTLESVDVTETEERKAQRALSRFQAVAKAEEHVARAYLALHPKENATGSAFHRSLEGGGEVVFNFVDEKKRGKGEEAALEHYFDDEVWEAGAAKPARRRDGRWTAVGAVLPSGVQEKKLMLS